MQTLKDKDERKRPTQGYTPPSPPNRQAAQHGTVQPQDDFDDDIPI